MKNDKDKNGKGFEEVADDIKDAIAKGEIRPGQRLVEKQLCELFGVKRNKVREALRKLQHEGFINITPNVGAMVAEFSRADLEHMYDLLGALDGLAVRTAAPFITRVQLDNLEKVLERMEATDNPSLYARYNEEFHSLIATYSENNRLMWLTVNLRVSIEVFGYQSFYAPGQIEASNAEHRAIIQAIKDKKPIRAEQIMRDHIFDAKNRLLIYLQNRY